MEIKQALKQVSSNRDLSRDEMKQVMSQIMSGEATPAQIGGLIMALRMKGETVDEITGAAETMRALAQRVDVSDAHLVDTCGTGGDGLHTFNVSTTAGFVVAAAGGTVAKHGNRSVSSSSGSADLLEAAGVNIEISPERNKQIIEDIGIGFMFAPGYHQATRYAVGPRKELGIRTIFNVLGPLTNPAFPPHQVVGIFSKEWISTIANVLKNLGSKAVMVVSGADGADEITICDATHVAELKDGEVEEYVITPEEFGLERADASAIAVASPEESLAIFNHVIDGGDGPARDIVLINAGAALYVAGLAVSIQDGIEKSARAIDSGSARDKVAALIDATNQT